ncbi:transposase [Hymenobacter psychrophilus]|uniref:Transposase n=1 Tax=Hymenobacter psychrophilus TaxID=651662 RepID=A0A1H3PHN3_9BACT|nr:transposase [Hymenobacter psychrophilus]SDZ00478.1 Transposase [Hymenobacter psychrophilus]
MRGLGAVQLLEGSLNYVNFAWYVTECLVPTLQPGDVLVLDNLSVHKLPGVVDWLAERGVQVAVLPPYSPNFSPVEQAWSKFKTKLRATQARTRQALEQVLEQALQLDYQPGRVGLVQPLGRYHTQEAQ